jgi:hypothetical protein
MRSLSVTSRATTLWEFKSREEFMSVVLVVILGGIARHVGPRRSAAVNGQRRP